MVRLFLYSFLLVIFSCTGDLPDYAHHRTSYFKNLHEQSFSDSSFICATFNIQLGFPNTKDPWNSAVTGADSLQVERIAAMVEQVGADIVALQEVPRNRYNAVIKDFIEKLAARLGMNYAFGAHGYNDPTGIYPVYGEWGNAILSKYTITGIENIEVSYVEQWQKRSILCARLKVNDSFSLNAISLHYDNSLGEMNEAIANTRVYLRQLKEPVLLMGDSNYQWEVEKFYTEFEGEGLTDADSTSLTGIDRILFTKLSFHCQEVNSWYDTVYYISDHPLNWCRLKIIQ
ncbi:MAG: endonuclease/exonuclease/phosphatase family protein [Lentimicrobium sp.]